MTKEESNNSKSLITDRSVGLPSLQLPSASCHRP